MTFDWTNNRCEQLRELLEGGVSFGNVAKMFGCSRNAVIGKAHRLGIISKYKDGPSTFGKRLVQAAKEAVAFARGERSDCVVHIPKVAEAPKGEVALLDLQPHHCRYPFDGGLFCGKPRVREAYCAFHAKLCYLSSGHEIDN